MKRRRVGASIFGVTPDTPRDGDRIREADNTEDFTLGILGDSEIVVENEFGQAGFDPRIEVDVDVESSSADSDTFEDYMDLVLADCANFYQILPTLFVVQGWDGTQLTVSIYQTIYSEMYECLYS